jgi:hypothetical protein
MPNDATLLKTQKNEVLAMLHDAGLRPEEFGWTTKEYVERSRYGPTHYTISLLRHVAERYYCEFLPNGALSYSPGEEHAVDFQEVEGGWSDIREALGLWLRCLHRQLTAPDLWASIGQESVLSTAASSTVDNQPFTATEQHLIATKLDEIKGHILENQQFAADQAEFVEERFAYFKESSTRMGRKDWLNVLYGGLITVIVGVALAPDAAKSLLRLAAAAFQSLWGMAQGQLP